MNNVQKIGGIGALMLAVYFVWILGFVFALLPAQGFTTPDSLNDPVWRRREQLTSRTSRR
jgi:hypothetical protein